MAEMTVAGGAAVTLLVGAAATAADVKFQADGVILFAVLGAGVAAWVQQARHFKPTMAWAAAALGAFFMAVVTGVVTPHVVFAYAPAVAILNPMAAVPPYIVALASAAASQMILTWGGRWLRGGSKPPTASESPSDQ